MYEDPGEPESSMQPEWEIDPADLVIGVKARACWCPVRQACTPSALSCSLCSMLPIQSRRGACLRGGGHSTERRFIVLRSPASLLQCNLLRWRLLQLLLLGGELGT